MLRLVEPAPIYKAAILDAVAEMQAIGEWDISPQAFAARFDDMLAEIAAAKDPATAAPGVLPYEDFWLIEQDSWIGLLTLRLQLNEQFFHSGGHIGYVIRPSKRRRGYGTVLLRLGLDKARDRGLERVLLTCNETNIASRKIIEANGGQFENAVVVALHDSGRLNADRWAVANSAISLFNVAGTCYICEQYSVPTRVVNGPLSLPHQQAEFGEKVSGRFINHVGLLYQTRDAPCGLLASPSASPSATALRF